MQQYPRVGVVGLIRNGNGKVLMQRRHGSRIPEADGKWEFPGGKVDFGEAPDAALRREILEETGCEVVVGRLIPLAVSKVWETATGERRHFIALCYECWYMSGEPRTAPGASDAVRWCSVSEVAALDTLEGVPALMEAAGLGERQGP